MRVKGSLTNREYDVIFEGKEAFFVSDIDGHEHALSKEHATPIRAFKRGDPVVDNAGYHWLVWGYASSGEARCIRPMGVGHFPESDLRLDTSEGEG